jgi:hypothetical protein
MAQTQSVKLSEQPAFSTRRLNNLRKTPSLAPTA